MEGGRVERKGEQWKGTQRNSLYSAICKKAG